MAKGFSFENAGIHREAISAWIRLSEAQEEVASYNCKDNPYFYTDYSDHNEEVVITGEDAESLCYQCPLIKLCYEFATINKEEYGIWGGINFALKPNELW